VVARSPRSVHDADRLLVAVADGVVGVVEDELRASARAVAARAGGALPDAAAAQQQQRALLLALTPGERGSYGASLLAALDRLVQLVGLSAHYVAAARGHPLTTGRARALMLLVRQPDLVARQAMSLQPLPAILVQLVDSAAAALATTASTDAGTDVRPRIVATTSGRRSAHLAGRAFSVAVTPGVSQQVP